MKRNQSGFAPVGLMIASLLIISISSFALAQIQIHPTTDQTTRQIFEKSPDTKDTTSIMLKEKIPSPQQEDFFPSFPLQSDTLDCEDFVYFNHYTLAELLKFSPGLWLRSSGGFGQPIWLQMSGLPIGQSGLCLDGLPLEDIIGGMPDLNFIPVEWIKRIEFYSQGVLLPAGTWPMAGMINLATKATTPQQPTPYSKVTYRTGSFDFSDVNVLFARSFGGVCSLENQKSKTDTSQTGLSTGLLSNPRAEIFWPAGRKDLLLGTEILGTNGRFVNSRYDGQKIYTRIGYFPTKNMQLTYQLLFNRVEAGFPGAISSPGQVEYPNLHRKQRRYDHRLAFLWQTSPHFRQLWQANAALYLEEWTDWSQPLHFRQRFATPGISYSGEFLTKRHKLSWSASLKYLSISGRDSLWHTEKPMTLSISEQINLNKQVRLGGVLRYDCLKSDLHGPSLQLFLQERIKNRHDWKLILARNTLFPTPGQLHRILPAFLPVGMGTETIYGMNDSLQVESKTFSTGVLQSAHLKYQFVLSPRFQIQAEIFHHTLSDFPQWRAQDSSTLVAENSGEMNSLGGSCSLGGAFLPYLNWCLVYDYLSTRDAKTPQIQELPQHYLRGWVRYGQRFFQGDLGVNFILSGEWLGERSGQNLDGGGSQWTGSSVSILNAKLVLDFGQAKIFYEIDNILNTEYELIPFYPMPGKIVRYGIAWEFFD